MQTTDLQYLVDRPFCIYGAGIVAAGVYTAIKALYHKVPLFFLISDLNDKDQGQERSHSEIDGIPVKQLSDWKHELQDGVFCHSIPMYYLIATPEEHHTVIVDSLRSQEGICIEDTQMYLFTNKLENKLMELYYSSFAGHNTVFNLLQLDLIKKAGKGEDAADIPKIQVFQAKSHMDKPLLNQYTNTDSLIYLYPIQVGAALTDRKIVDLQDSAGDNISAKNRNYCELTATYYAWKHSHAAYKGICHYRRVFDISDDQMQKLLDADREWDVILPYPSVHYPDISTQHTRYVTENDWDAMLQALKEAAPEYLSAYEKSIAEGERFFYNFNMLIAKAPVFDDYCDFLFRVLERTEELTAPKGWERADRFAGYLGENLTTIYFLKNCNKWKIAYAGKVWLT